ncbi:MAG: hypothetical protein Fur0043_25120 [Anaerolineales bacterium]
MSARVKFGLIAGAIGLILTACASVIVGCCGPLAALAAGAAAGYFAVKGESPTSQNEGGKIGAIAGAIAGALTLIGQVLGGLVSLTVAPTILEQLGNYSYGPLAKQASYWLSGAATACCFGLLGAALAAAAGFAAGYFSSKNLPTPPLA